MHKDIVRFTEEGSFKSDADMYRTRCNLERIIEDKMRAQGYIPVLDLCSDWSISYLESSDQYTFVISLYGVESDQDKAAGYSNGRFIKIR